MTITLSPRQQAILDFIQHEVQKKGYPPSVREIGKAVGLSSSSTVHGHLHRLEKRGFLRRDATKPRAIELLKDDALGKRKKLYLDTAMLPLIGKIAAGDSITAIENIEEYYPIPCRIIGPNEESVFLLSVRGDSMINAGIYNGDIIVIKKQQTAQNGDVVVAITEGNEVTVRRFFKEADQIRLQPENDLFEPVFLPTVTILGKVISLVREII